VVGPFFNLKTLGGFFFYKKFLSTGQSTKIETRDKRKDAKEGGRNNSRHCQQTILRCPHANAKVSLFVLGVVLSLYERSCFCFSVIVDHADPPAELDESARGH
jgi:hypothetical protein